MKAVGLGIAAALVAGWTAAAATHETARAADSTGTPAPMPTVIGNVVVATGSRENLHRLPFAASVLDAAAIENASATTSDALLRALPGFDRTRSNSAFTNYGQLRVSFSGAGNDRGLVLVDGLPADDGFGGQIDWQAYPPAEIVRAELLRGAGSALYGSGAIGGVLDLTLFRPQSPQSPPRGRFASSIGTEASKAVQVREEGRIAPHLSAAASFDADTESAYTFPVGYRSAVDAPATSKADVIRAGVRYEVGGAVLDAGALSAYDAQAEGRPNYSFDRKLHEYDFGYARTWGREALKVLGFARDGIVDNTQDQYPKAPGVPLYVQRVPTHESMIAAIYTHTAPASEFQARADLRAVSGIADQFAPGGTLESEGSGSQLRDGVATQWVARTTRAEGVVGLRLDDVGLRNAAIITASGATVVAPRDDTAVSPRLAARYDLSSAVAIRASAGSGFRAPFLNELLRSFNVAGIEMLGNPSLLPERSATTSIGIDAAGAKTHLALDVFQTTVHDAIAFVTVNATTQMRQNVARTQTNGATLTLTHALGRCLLVRAGGTSEYARVTAGPSGTVGKRLAFVPDKSASVGLEGGTGRLAVGLDATYLGQTFADDSNTQALGTAWVFGARVIVWVGSRVGVTLAADNLSSQSYRASLDRLGPPPTVSIGIRMPFGTQEPSGWGRCGA
jgi:outer membrane receptor protein involved in Fe transport